MQINNSIYSDDRFLKIASTGCFKPAWLQVSHNGLIDYVFSKCIFKKRDHVLLINFTKKTLNYFKLKGVCIAVCENEDECRKLKSIWNASNELFDKVFTEKEFYEWIEKQMKFDKIIMNPPYDGNSNLYGKLTLAAKQHSKEVICLSPYLNYLSTSQKKQTKEISKELMQYLESYELVDPASFDAAFDKELCIFHFKDNPSQKIDIDDLYWKNFSNPKLTKSILEKMIQYKDHCYDKIIPKKNFDNYKYKVAFAGTRGHAGNGIKEWDWTTLLDEEKMSNFKIRKDEGSNDMYAFPFNTEKECKEFVKWTNSDIFGYLILIQKHSIAMDKWLFKIIPYFDFKKEWNEKDRCKEFGLTKEEYDYIVDEMKDFGWKTRNQ